MNWFTDKLYDLGASPKAGEAAWGELAAQDAMSPATRSSYYAGSEMPPDPRAQGWAPDAEKTFQAGIRATPWFAEFKQKFGEEPNLNDPDYDYRRAWAAGARPTVRDPGDNLLHWSSQFKGENHPNRFGWFSPLNWLDQCSRLSPGSRTVGRAPAAHALR